jgi:aminoglycoside phosphotransferase (APT) family kinase protein
VTLKFAFPEGSLERQALAQAVDPKVMLEAFQRYLPPRDQSSWTRCELDKVRYQPGKQWRILYRLWKDTDEEGALPYFHYAEFLPPDRSLRKFLDLRRRGGPGAPSGYIAELNMIYWRFPADPKLVHLGALLQEGDYEVVAYVPTMSCVLSGEFGGQKTIIKMYRDERVERVSQVVRGLHEAGFASPRVLHVDASRRLLVLEHVPGRLFWTDPKSNLKREVMGAMARELSTLHDTRLDDETMALLPRIDHMKREWESFRLASKELVDAFPDLEDRLERLQTMLAPWQVENKEILLHGDFHPEQFLIHHGTPRLIDYDTVCLGDPMVDLARFSSHLYYKGMVHNESPRDIEKAVSAFRSAYIAQSAEHFNAALWFWHLSVSLVAKRAHRVMTRLETDADELVRRLLTIAEQNAVSIVRD